MTNNLTQDIDPESGLPRACE